MNLFSVKDINVNLKKKKKKRNNIIVKDVKISQRIKSKHWLSIEKTKNYKSIRIFWVLNHQSTQSMEDVLFYSLINSHQNVGNAIFGKIQAVLWLGAEKCTRSLQYSSLSTFETPGESHHKNLQSQTKYLRQTLVFM